MSWAVVKVRGSINVKPKIKETMKLMRLNRVNHCVIVPENETYEGMLKIIKDYVTWGEVDVETTELMLESSGKTSGNAIFTKKELKDSSFKTMKALAKNLSEGKVVMRDVPKLKPIFRLHPPRKGYEGVKRSFKEGGALGYRGEKINKLIRRMQYAQA
ncbi:MAG: 50S ribosomal protein L30 [Methanobacteriota archaeon]|jgi:large subunit ribosomal protein L30|uniref:Large ribosomal subunit protein uL30 n=1 Tax=Marine Group III euryarchaeote TaxID=2173149 RepID=A0A7J4GS02_9ARCH|nr:MAG: 50S ribosomal protein L30 [Euryarchaeota archaeon]HIF37298.1 50S ribosomal protein L30 [Marine Group III euryarchaeote]|tara:strand:- start:911 stop:1384 length:474 start_codon:yes stop_codon:yes gene_type:complete